MILIPCCRYEELPLATASGGLEPLPTGGQWVRDGNTILTLRAKVLSLWNEGQLWWLRWSYDDAHGFGKLSNNNFPETLLECCWLHNLRGRWDRREGRLIFDQYYPDHHHGYQILPWSPWPSNSASSSQSLGAVQDRPQQLTRSSSFWLERGGNPNRIPQETARHAPGICSDCLLLLR